MGTIAAQRGIASVNSRGISIFILYGLICFLLLMLLISCEHGEASPGPVWNYPASPPGTTQEDTHFSGNRPVDSSEVWLSNPALLQKWLQRQKAYSDSLLNASPAIAVRSTPYLFSLQEGATAGDAYLVLHREARTNLLPLATPRKNPLVGIPGATQCKRSADEQQVAYVQSLAPNRYRIRVGPAEADTAVLASLSASSPSVVWRGQELWYWQQQQLLVYEQGRQRSVYRDSSAREAQATLRLLPNSEILLRLSYYDGRQRFLQYGPGGINALLNRPDSEYEYAASDQEEHYFLSPYRSPRRGLLARSLNASEALRWRVALPATREYLSHAQPVGGGIYGVYREGPGLLVRYYSPGAAAARVWRDSSWRYSRIKALHAAPDNGLYLHVRTAAGANRVLRLRPDSAAVPVLFEEPDRSARQVHNVTSYDGVPVQLRVLAYAKKESPWLLVLDDAAPASALRSDLINACAERNWNVALLHSRASFQNETGQAAAYRQRRIDDLQAGIEFLRKLTTGKAAQISVFAEGCDALLAASTAIQRQGLASSYVLANGLYDPWSLARDEAYFPVAGFLSGDSLEQQYLRRYSPLYGADAVQDPVLLLQMGNGPQWPASQTYRMLVRMQGNSTAGPALLLQDDLPWTLQAQVQREQSLSRIYSFLRTDWSVR